MTKTYCKKEGKSFKNTYTIDNKERKYRQAILNRRDKGKEFVSHFILSAIEGELPLKEILTGRYVITQTDSPEKTCILYKDEELGYEYLGLTKEQQKTALEIRKRNDNNTMIFVLYDCEELYALAISKRQIVEFYTQVVKDCE